MWVLVVRQEGQEWRFPFVTIEVTIGRDERNDVVLSELNVSRRHARMVLKDGKYILVDLKSTHGTFVNGRRMTAPLLVSPSDDIRIDSYQLTYEDIAVAPVDDNFPASDPTEAQLLDAIARHDEASRLVYADWLEQHGDTARAEFLRVQEQLATGTDVDRWRHGTR